MGRISMNGLLVFATVVKLLALFLVYQFLFLMAGRIGGFLCYNIFVESVAYSVFEKAVAPPMSSYAVTGTAVGMLLSSLVMIAHLIFFKYVRIRKGFFREVKCSVLLLSVLFIFSMMVVFNIAAEWLGLENLTQHDVELLLKSTPGVLSIAFAAPLLEELLFRGAIQGMFMRIFNRPWVAIVLSAAIFGIIHFNPIQVFYATCLGVGFGWVYYRTGSLLPAVVGHVMNNFLAVVSGLIWGMDGELEVPADTGGEIVCVIFFATAALFIARIMDHWLPSVPSPWREAGDK